MKDFYEINKKMQCDSNAFESIHKFGWTVVSYLLSEWIEWATVKMVEIKFPRPSNCYVFYLWTISYGIPSNLQLFKGVHLLPQLHLIVVFKIKQSNGKKCTEKRSKMMFE